MIDEAKQNDPKVESPKLDLDKLYNWETTKLCKEAVLFMNIFQISLSDVFKPPSGMIADIRKGWKVVWRKQPSEFCMIG